MRKVEHQLNSTESKRRTHKTLEEEEEGENLGVGKALKSNICTGWKRGPFMQMLSKNREMSQKYMLE